MIKLISVKTTFSATHNYPDAGNFLKNEHRHLFFICVKIRVWDNNREIEFLEKKKEIETYITEKYANRFLMGVSCEDIAEELLHKFGAFFVSVYEDNENGAEIYEE